MSKEKWKRVRGFPHYEVSSHGRVRSIDRTVTQPYRDRTRTVQLKGKILKGSPSSFGHLQVNLYKNGEPHHKDIHVLVARAFIGPRPARKETRHLDGNCQNNHYLNLEYGTSQENSQDTIRHGTVMRGSKHVNSKLTERDVRKIRSLIQIGKTQVLIARRFNVSSTTIDDIDKKRRWAWLE
jgi:hypothetical protein